MSYPFADIAGEKFGRLVVVERKGNKRYGCRKQGRPALWLCRCECGNTTVTTGINLRSGSTKSCGCLRSLKQHLRKLPGIASRNKILASYRRAAEKRGFAFLLSDEDAFNLFSQVCAYCGVGPSNLRKGPCGDFLYGGIDRVDSTRGYELSNVVPCCVMCNRAKRNYSQREFTEWIDRLVKNRQVSKVGVSNVR